MTEFMSEDRCELAHAQRLHQGQSDNQFIAVTAKYPPAWRLYGSRIDIIAQINCMDRPGVGDLANFIDKAKQPRCIFGGNRDAGRCRKMYAHLQQQNTARHAKGGKTDYAKKQERNAILRRQPNVVAVNKCNRDDHTQCDHEYRDSEIPQQGPTKYPSTVGI
jgi:hypothetical protein